MHAAEALENLLTKLGLPTRLEQVGLKQSDYPRIGEIAVKSIFARTNPRSLREPGDVVQLLTGEDPLNQHDTPALQKL
jgi:alcohol dehydrogenase class IV